jgi:hypothetical protein
MQAGQTWTGLPGLTAEDAAMVTSSTIYDRSKENLVPADLAVIRVRRILLECARRVRAGEEPIGIKTTTLTEQIAAGSGLLAPGDDWHEIVPDHCTHREPRGTNDTGDHRP